jgi:hypothetical protein
MSTDLVLLARAADYAARQHIAQRRKGERGEPYVNHLTEVTALLAEATDGSDVVLLMGGLLHDTLEDTDATYEDLVERFGPDVASLVAEVTDVQPARLGCEPAGGMDRGAAARLCRVGQRCRAVMPRAQPTAGGRLRRCPCKGEPALRLKRKPCSTMPPSAITACRRTR